MGCGTNSKITNDIEQVMQDHDKEYLRQASLKIKNRKPTGATQAPMFSGKHNMKLLMARENAKLSAMEYLEGLYEKAINKAVQKKKSKKPRPKK